MSLLAAWVLYPLVLALLCGGLGLGVELLSGRRLPGALIVPVGLAAMVVVGGFTTLSDATAELTLPLVLGLAVLGAGLSLASGRLRRPDPWPLAVAVGVFLVFGAPVYLSGHPTFAGYIKLDDTATWLAIADRVMEHGRSLAGLAPSSYRATLESNLPGGYPIGAFIPFGTAQKLVGGDLAWVFQPYLSFLAAMLALSLWEVLRIVRRPHLRAFAVFVAAQPALLYGYAMWGGVKEMAAAVLVALAAALAAGLLADAVPLALAAAALVGVLSLGGLVWIGPMLVAVVLLVARALGPRAAAGRAAAFAIALVVFVLPTFLAGGFDPLQSGLTSASELGNLAGPLSGFQLLGVWPAGDFRLHPDASALTAVLVALTLAAALFGLWAAWRRRALAALLFATALIACAAIAAVGSPWVGAKALATASPIALSLAALGALAALRVDRPAGGVLVVAVVGGVLWSNVLAYGGVSLAPYGLLRELQSIGHRFAGQGPTLMTEYNPYGARHFLREADGEGASELRNRGIPLRGGGEPEKGEPVDTDRITLPTLFTFRTLVLRRSPLASRPPLPYLLVRAGRYYEVWQRPEGTTEPPVAFLPLGNAAEPTAVPACSAVVSLARRARRIGASRLVAASHAPVFDATRGPFTVPSADRYTAWLKGSVRGSVELYVDGAKVGEARQRIENRGGFVELGTARLSAGRHGAELRFGGADLHPGSGGFPRPPTGPLLFAPAADRAGLLSVPLDEATRLCGRRWDWLEAATTS